MSHLLGENILYSYNLQRVNFSDVQDIFKNFLKDSDRAIEIIQQVKNKNLSSGQACGKDAKSQLLS